MFPSSGNNFWSRWCFVQGSKIREILGSEISDGPSPHQLGSRIAIGNFYQVKIFFVRFFFTLPKIHKNTRENNRARAVASALTLRGTRAKGVRNSKSPNPSQMGLSGAQIQGYRRHLMEILSNRVIYQVPGSRKPWKCFLATNNWLGNHLRPPRRPHTTHRLPEAKVATK